jgi:ABC-type multidrug transport system ATPase subunit/ABC-type multidrug transport system permease subunit
MEERTNLNNQGRQSPTESKQQFIMSWKEIFYEVSIKGKENKAILNKVSGYARSGELLAIMGPSGSGKTSLLNYLNDRIQFPKNSKHSGEIFINNEKITTSQITDFSSYVMQDDLLFDILTPKETLIFVAKLKKLKTEEEYEKEVNTLIEILKLKNCEDTRIGNENTKGISGGERKRTSIGVEIISDPSILFLDEPTSGLDSQTSLIVIDFLKDLAKSKNLMIVFTIHQPSSNIVSKFDRLLILNKGNEVYQGETSRALNYFTHTLKMESKSKANPVDAFMHFIEEENSKIEKMLPDQENSSRKTEYNSKKSVTDIYRSASGLKEGILNEINSNLQKGPANLKKKNIENVGFCREFSLLAKRQFLNLIRNPMTLRIRLIMVLIFSFITCSIFYNMKNDTTGIYNKSGFFFFFSVNNFMSIIFAAVLAFPPERGVFLREYSAKLYGVLPYYISKNVIETPISLCITALFSIIVYYIVGLRPEASHYGTFILIFVCLSWFSQSMGLCIGAAFSNINAAITITQFSVLPSFLFSGFLINGENMPAWLAWIRYFSPFRYSIEAAMRNEFDDNSNIPYEMNPVTNLNLNFGMWTCVGVMIAWGVLLRIIGLICLKLLVRKVG